MMSDLIVVDATPTEQKLIDEIGRLRAERDLAAKRGDNTFKGLQKAQAKLKQANAVVDKALDEEFISNEWLQEALAALESDDE